MTYGMKIFLKTINGKISLIFLFMTLLSVVSIALGSHFIQRNYRIRMLQNEQRNLDLHAESMNTSLKLLEELLLYLPYYNTSLRTLEQVENNASVDPAMYWQATSDVMTQFQSVSYVYKYVENMFVYYPEQDLFINSKVNEDMTSVIILNILDDATTNSQWKLTKLSSGWYIYRINYIRKAYIGVWISCDKMLQSFELNQENMYLVDEQGLIVNGGRSTENLDVERLFAEEDDDERQYIISALSGAGLFLINEVEDISLGYSGEMFFMNGYLPLILLINILTLIITMVGILAWVHKPLKYLLSGIEKIREGDTQYRIESSQEMSLEFIEICEQLNEMLDQLKKTKIQVYEQEIERGRTKLRYLSQQIRPHFMLNALNTVYSYSKKDIEVARKIIRLLTAYYRYVVNVDSDYVPISKELEHIENYLAFQKVRYEEVLEYYIECEPALKVVPIPPFLMESFVGNSLKYGADQNDKIYISIVIKQIGDFNLKILISDKGEGFPEEVLEAIRSFKESGEVEEMLGVGIRNSIERIRLIYQDKADLEIYNDHGAVTEITIHLQKEQER